MECSPSNDSLPAVRHAEKRRISTCSFADRVARFCVDHYRDHVPLSFREEQKQTCLAAIVALWKGEQETSTEEQNENSSNSRLYMLGMGVGTKFLSIEVLQSETEASKDLTSEARWYGRRVRDCHAEVLARRAFRRQLSLCMLRALESTGSDEASEEAFPPLLERLNGENGAISFILKPGVSLHMYTSSAPCGNATLKKFATMKKESFREELSINEWPQEAHERILGHSIPLGQFALLVKKDPAVSVGAVPALPEVVENHHVNENKTTRLPPNGAKQRSCPVRESTEWCPAGTSTVWSGEGELHTCSDKICRWNFLGLQGSLLASLLQQPLYMSSLTVGRKLTECICRRAVCCRAAAGKSKSRKKKTQERKECVKVDAAPGNSYGVNHPAIMGTAVYMDENGVIEDEDVRFPSTLSWAWWPAIAMDQSTVPDHRNIMAECIDGATGYAIDGKEGSEYTTQGCDRVSRISTAALLDLHYQLISSITSNPSFGESSVPSTPVTLKGLREYKQQYSPVYETQKEQLMSKHPLFRQWKRRQTAVKEVGIPSV